MLFRSLRGFHSFIQWGRYQRDYTDEKNLCSYDVQVENREGAYLILDILVGLIGLRNRMSLLRLYLPRLYPLFLLHLGA